MFVLSTACIKHYSQFIFYSLSLKNAIYVNETAFTNVPSDNADSIVITLYVHWKIHFYEQNKIFQGLMYCTNF